jgi:hypothetical protein
MTVLYADDLRKQLKAVDRTLQTLVNERHDALILMAEKEFLFKRISADGPQSRSATMLNSLPRIIAALASEARALESKISEQQMLHISLRLKLQSAPKRPRSRSIDARIAASGSREVGIAAKGRLIDCNIALGVWDSALVAAKATASKFDVGVPASAKEAIKARWMERFPGFNLIEENGNYHVVPTIVKGSVRKK